MRRKYEDRPSKLWYVWQNTKGMIKSLTDPALKNDARAGAKSGGKAAGVLIGGGILTKIGIIAILPLVPTVITIAAVGGAGYYGVGAWRKFKLVKNSSAYASYMRKQEQKWVDNKNRPPLLQRLKTKFNKKMDSLPRSVLMLGKWGGLALAVAGAAAFCTLAVPMVSSGAAAHAILHSLVKISATIGLHGATMVYTAAGVSAAAAVVGRAVGVTCRDAVYRTDPDRPHFGERAPKNAAPAPQNSAPKAALPSAENAFNDNAQKSEPAAQDGLSEERKRAAEDRAAARKRNRGGQRFS